MTGSSARPDVAQPTAAVVHPAGAAGIMRLRPSRDVRAVFSARRAVSSSLAVVHIRCRDDEYPARATTVAGRGVGNAVERNRVKRRLRGALLDCGLAAGADYVVVGRRAVLTADAAQLRAALRRQTDAAVARCS